MAGSKIKAAVCCNMGKVRRNNEDNFYLAGKYMPLKQMDAGGTFTFEGTGSQIFAVCDGMGGGEAGEEASFMVADALNDAIVNGGITSAKQICDIMQRTSNKIHKRHSSVCGSTLALLALDNGHVLIMNIGDSRIYRLRNGKLKQVSVDHVGLQAHSITQYIGMDEDEPLAPHMRMDDMGEWTVSADTDNVYLLCSDGLTDLVADADIKKVLLELRDPKAAAEKLVDMALMRGGKDNTTVMVVRVTQDMMVMSSKRKISVGLLLGAIGCGVVMLLALIDLFMHLI